MHLFFNTICPSLQASLLRVGYLFAVFFFYLSCCVAYGSFTHEVKTDVVEKPVVWGKPLSGGPIRALFVAPRFTLGDVAQLSARLDLDYDTVALWSAYSLGYDPMAFASLPDGGRQDEVLTRLRDRLNGRLDVIVLANFDTDILPEEVFSAILDKVAGGTGLLLVHTHNGADSPLHVILDALPIYEGSEAMWAGTGACLFPGQDRLEEVGRVFLHGSGRIVHLGFLGDPPQNHCLIQSPGDSLDLDAFFADNAYSFVARAVCIAAGRRKGFRISGLQDQAPQGPQDDEIPPDLLPEFVQSMRDSVVAQPARPFLVSFNKPTENHCTISAQLRRVASNVLISWHDPEMLPKGTTMHQFEIPVGSGAYTLDVWVHDRSGIVDWYSQDFVLSGWPEFYDLKLEKTWLLPNDSLDVSVNLRPVANHTRNATVYARALDGYGRVVSEAAVEANHQGGLMRLRLHFTDLISTLIKVEVFALEGGKRLYSEWELQSAFRDIRYVSVRQKPEPNRMDVVVTIPDIREYQPIQYLGALSGLGVNWVHGPASEAMIVNVANRGMSFLPQVDGKAIATVREGRYREPCLSAPGFRSENKDAIRDATLRHWAGCFGRYSLGDSNSISNVSPMVCQSRHCMQRLQEMLAQEYDSIAKLNAAWASQFGDWDFVEMPLGFGPGEKQPPAPWIDFRRGMDAAFAEYNGWARQVVQHTDNAAVVGARFRSDSVEARGYDWPLLFDVLDFVVCDYSPLMLDKTRSYSKRAAWTGTVLRQKEMPVTPEWYAWLSWHLLCQGIHAIWLDDVYGSRDNPAPDSWLSPDGTAASSLQVLVQTVNKINETVGPLIYAAEPNIAAIGIYDSQSSRHLAAVDRAYERNVAESQEAVTSILRLAGYPFYFVDKTGLLEISPEKYKALVLPSCRALGADEIAALKGYVQAGGALIADLVPGDCDIHGVPWGEYPLAQLFGIGCDKGPLVEVGMLSAVLEDSPGDQDAGIVAVNTAVTLAAGVALGAVSETPAWVVNRLDAGHTLLLNHPFRSVKNEEGRRIVPHEYHAIKTFIADLPGIQQPVLPESFLGTVNTFSFGDATIYAVLPDLDGSRQSIRLPISKNAAAYNMFTGEQVRRPHRARFQVTDGEPLFVAALPQPVEKIAVRVPEIVHIGQRLPIQVIVSTGKGRAGKHLLGVDLMPINGVPLARYHRVVTAEAGVGETFIPLALNEILGKYSIRVRDMLTGMEQTIPIALSSPESEYAK